jgi:hypothetical protein
MNPVVSYILSHLCSAGVGAIAVKMFLNKAKAFLRGEEAAVQAKIEAIKATDIKKYNTLLAEWNNFLQDEKVKIANLSTDLRNIIFSVTGKL